MKLSVFLPVQLILLIRLCLGQQSASDDNGDRGFLFNRRPLHGGGGGSVVGGGSPCGEDYDPIDPDQRSLLAVLGGAAIGGVAGYHLGMKKGQKQPVIINNNVYNQLPSPCYSIPVHVTTAGGGGGGSGIGGGGLIGGILSNHPILSNILQGGWLGGNGNGGGWQQNRVTNRNIRQFRRVVRPITRVFR